MESNFKTLSKLYDQVFKEFKKFLPEGKRVVFCLPAYKVGHTDYEHMPSLDFATENGYTVLDPIPAELAAKYKFLRVTDRKSIVYDRKDQVVAREILVFHNGEVKAPEALETASISNQETVDNAYALETESEDKDAV